MSNVGHHTIMRAMPETASDLDVVAGIATSLNNSGCTEAQIVRYLETRRPRALAAIAR
jgi:hypothetical protein